MKMPKAVAAALMLVSLVLAAYMSSFGGRWKTQEIRSEVPVVRTGTASSAAEIDVKAAGEADPKQRRPTVVSGGEAVQDSISIDDQVGLRTFKIKLQYVGPGEDLEHVVSAAYVDQLPKTDMSWRITYVADQGAGYGDEFSQELPSGRDGLRLWFHVGNFAQDNCGDLTALFAAQTSTVFMVSFADQALTDQLLQGADCEQAPKSGPPAIDYCEKRSACVAKHLTGNLDPQLANQPAARALRQLVLE